MLVIWNLTPWPSCPIPCHAPPLVLPHILKGYHMHMLVLGEVLRVLMAHFHSLAACMVCAWYAPRPLLSGWLTPDRGRGGGPEAKTVCVPKIDLQVRAPLISFTLSRGNIL